MNSNPLLTIRTKDDADRLATLLDLYRENKATLPELGDTVIRAFKFTCPGGNSPIYPGLNYAVGVPVEVKRANKDECEDCAEGVNVGTLEYCRYWKNRGDWVFAVEFRLKDIAAMPRHSRGGALDKFRLFRCTPVKRL